MGSPFAVELERFMDDMRTMDVVGSEAANTDMYDLVERAGRLSARAALCSRGFSSEEKLKGMELLSSGWTSYANTLRFSSGNKVTVEPGVSMSIGIAILKYILIEAPSWLCLALPSIAKRVTTLIFCWVPTVVDNEENADDGDGPGVPPP